MVSGSVSSRFAPGQPLASRSRLRSWVPPSWPLDKNRRATAVSGPTHRPPAILCWHGDLLALETRVQKVLDAPKKAEAQDPNDLSAELKNATDDYARAVRDLQAK